MNNETQPRTYRREGVIALLVFLLAIYIGSFFYLSRAGIKLAEEAGISGYYAFLDNDESVESNLPEDLLTTFYFPLIEVDAGMISGQQPGPPLPPPYYMTDDCHYYPSAP